MSNPLPPVPEALVQIHARAFRHHIPVTDLLKEAKIAGSSWTAWRKSVTPPNEEKLAVLESTLDAMIERAANPPKKARKGGARA